MTAEQFAALKVEMDRTTTALLAGFCAASGLLIRIENTIAAGRPLSGDEAQKCMQRGQEEVGRMVSSFPTPEMERYFPEEPQQ